MVYSRPPMWFLLGLFWFLGAGFKCATEHALHRRFRVEGLGFRILGLGVWGIWVC